MVGSALVAFLVCTTASFAQLTELNGVAVELMGFEPHADMRQISHYDELAGQFTMSLIADCGDHAPLMSGTFVEYSERVAQPTPLTDTEMLEGGLRSLNASIVVGHVSHALNEEGLWVVAELLEATSVDGNITHELEFLFTARSETEAHALLECHAAFIQLLKQTEATTSVPRLLSTSCDNSARRNKFDCHGMWDCVAPVEINRQLCHEKRARTSLLLLDGDDEDVDRNTDIGCILRARPFGDHAHL